MKRCPRCGLQVALEDFALSVGYCKACNRERAREWQKANPERRKVLAARHREKHREKRRVDALAYYYKRMAEDPEAVRKNRREWAKTPQGRLANRLARHVRRGAKSDKAYVAILLHDPCSYCGGRGGEIDHITPLAAGGSGEWTNLTSACRRCNAQKNDRLGVLMSVGSR